MPKHNKPLSGGNNWNRQPDSIKHNKKRNNNPWSQNYGQEEEGSVYGNNIPSYKYSQPQLRSPEELLSPIDENGQKLANFASRVAVNPWRRQNTFALPQSRLTFSKEKNCNCDKEQENDFLGEYSLPHSRTGLSADSVYSWEQKPYEALNQNNSYDKKTKGWDEYLYELPYSYEYDTIFKSLLKKNLQDNRERAIVSGKNFLLQPYIRKQDMPEYRKDKYEYFILTGESLEDSQEVGAEGSVYMKGATKLIKNPNAEVDFDFHTHPNTASFSGSDFVTTCANDDNVRKNVKNGFISFVEINSSNRLAFVIRDLQKYNLWLDSIKDTYVDKYRTGLAEKFRIAYYNYLEKFDSGLIACIAFISFARVKGNVQGVDSGIDLYQFVKDEKGKHLYRKFSFVFIHESFKIPKEKFNYLQAIRIVKEAFYENLKP